MQVVPGSPAVADAWRLERVAEADETPGIARGQADRHQPFRQAGVGGVCSGGFVLMKGTWVVGPRSGAEGRWAGQRRSRLARWRGVVLAARVVATKPGSRAGLGELGRVFLGSQKRMRRKRPPLISACEPFARISAPNSEGPPPAPELAPAADGPPARVSPSAIGRVETSREIFFVGGPCPWGVFVIRVRVVHVENQPHETLRRKSGISSKSEPCAPFFGSTSA